MLYHIYSGHLFFTSISIFVAVVVLDMCEVFDRSHLRASVSRVVALASIALAALSGTPVSIWLAVPACAVAIGYVVAGSGLSSRNRRLSGISAILLALVCVGVELPYHLTHPPIARPERLIVVGDSLSSGGFDEGEPWPERVASKVGAAIVNLARPGDTIDSATKGQVPDIPSLEAGDVVILEIGGNDMLEGTGARRFESQLTELAESVVASGRPVAMFELPLLPGRWAYGGAQRRVARRFGIALIPKRILAGVLLGPDNTSDGLHLTEQGHLALARETVDWAGW